MVFKKRFAGEVFLEFLRRLVRQSSRKVYLIVDRHPAHRSRKIKNWLAEKAEQIRVFFLTGYSPELNPEEMLNQDVKSNVVGRKGADDQEEMLNRVRSFLRRRQLQPLIVAKYFLEKHVRYTAA